MPIVEQAPDESPLSQGDILRKVPFAMTNVEGQVAADVSSPYALVISRPCHALREHLIVIAPVVPFTLDLKEIPKDPEGALERTRRAFGSLRDGIVRGDFSDRLYLGAFDGTKQRFAAELSRLASVEVPAISNKDERTKWVRDRRAGRLSGDFLRDLHTRLALSYTRLGFDDQGWFSDPDLEVMINAGETEVTHLQAQVHAAERAIHESEAANRTVSSPQRRDVENRIQALEAARNALQPFLDERERRRSSKS